jgi:uncharacterized protein YodC (DUF2158 family)
MKQLTMEIKAGDVVWLKSGGPKMTVKSIDSKQLCKCIWFQHGEIHHCDFEIVTLTKNDPTNMFLIPDSKKDGYAL